MKIVSCLACGVDRQLVDDVYEFECLNCHALSTIAAFSTCVKCGARIEQGKEGHFCMGLVKQQNVDHPAHYGGDTTYEAIKVIEAWGLDFAFGNAVKYIARAGKKDPTKTLEDLEKARWYLERVISQLKGSP